MSARLSYRPQAAKLIEPCKRPLDDPPPPAQAAAVLGATHRQQRQNVPRAQAAPDGCRIIATVAVHAHWPAPGSAAFASKGRNRINQSQGLLRVISISAGQADREWDALPVTDQMSFTPTLGAIGGIRTCLRAATDSPHRATVNDRTRPINSGRERASSKAKCIRSQMPSCCLSRRRRQQVIRDPQPSSFGNICHGIPLRNTKRIPVRQARSGTRGRPPFSCGDEAGRSGSMRSHSASGNSTAAINCRR